MSRRAEGLKAWLWQRVTAVYLAIFVLYLVGHFVYSPPQSHAEWRLWVADPRVSITVLLFFAALLMHAWIGMRNILIDYIGPYGLRATLLALLGAGLMALGAWGLQVVVLARVV